VRLQRRENYEMDLPNPMNGQIDPQIIALSDVVVGMHSSVSFVVSREDMHAFGNLSGDLNPLHANDSFARKKGFQGAVVYGALLVAKVSQLIGMKLPGRDSVWFSLDIHFHNPLYVDEPAQVDAEVVRVSPATRLVGLKLTIRAGDRLLAKGKAEVQLAGS
jgi:acyl dehydratase